MTGVGVTGGGGGHKRYGWGVDQGRMAPAVARPIPLARASG